MKPITIDGCFGWLHDVESRKSSDVGILLCTGLSQEASSAHRPFRQLADRLSEAGYPTVRYDYPGTGDSIDLGETGTWQTWLDSVHGAIDWMRSTLGIRRVVLVGLRVGSLLAAIAAEARHDVIGLVFLEPVWRGRSYVSQLSVEARLRDGASGPRPDGLELGELRLDEDSVRWIRALDLGGVVLPDRCAIAVFARSESTALRERVRAFNEAGYDVETATLNGLEALLRPVHLTDEPDAEFSPILNWLERKVLPQSGTVFGIWHAERPVLRTPEWIETPERFGKSQTLFAVLCRPRGREAGLVVVIGNSAGNPHHGFARFSVELARRLAATGIASLRVDFAGLGDSLSLKDGAETTTHVFDVSRVEEMRGALAFLSGLGFKHIAAFGLCSGAYHALHGLVGEPGFCAAALVNLPWITLRHERPDPLSIARQTMEALSQRHVELLLLFGEGDGGLKTLEKHFGAECAALRTLAHTRVEIRSGIDHDLSSRSMRHMVADRMLCFYREVEAGLNGAAPLPILGDIAAPLHVIEEG